MLSNFTMSTIVNETCTIRYTPLNPVLSFCVQALGPPLDNLRKPADVYSGQIGYHKKTSSSVAMAERRSKWWLCLAGMIGISCTHYELLLLLLLLYHIIFILFIIYYYCDSYIFTHVYYYYCNVFIYKLFL